jgi:hypothetical protein
MKTTRRQFIGSAAAAAAVTFVPRHVLGGPRFVPPSEKVNVALVGAGGQGRTNTRALFQESDVQVIAVADPADHWNLDAFYYQGDAGRKPVKAEVEKHYGAKTPNFRCPEWDLWLGPRQPRPFHPAYAPVTWRDFWAFGTGTMGDFGCHDLDNSLWALDLNAPLSVEAFPAGNMDAEIAPHGEICYYEFGPRGDKPPVKITWYDGGLQPPWPKEMGPGRPLPEHGILFIGDKGKLLTEGWAGQQRLLPYEKTAAYKKPPKTLPRSKGHHRDWLDACKGGPPASANFQYGARLTELVLLGVLALRLGKRIAWDAVNLKVPGVAEADAISTSLAARAGKSSEHSHTAMSLVHRAALTARNGRFGESCTTSNSHGVRFSNDLACSWPALR